MTLDHEFRQILARLELVSAGTIYSYTPIASKGAFASGAPKTGDAEPPHITYRQRWDNAPDERTREIILHHAVRELEQLTRRTTPVPTTLETQDQRDRRIAKDGKGWSAQDAAVHFRCGITDIRKARAARGLDTEYGEPIHTSANVKPDRQQRAARAIELKAKGLSLRQISTILGCDHKTIANDLRNAA